MNQSAFSLEILNEQTLISLLPVTVFIVLELSIGFSGNCLILWVYLKAYPQCNFRYFVLFLAVYDLTSCFTTLPGEVYAHFNWYDYKFDWLCKVKSFFNVFTAWGSAFTLFLLALDRCLKICRPLNSQIRHDLAKKLSTIGMFISALMSVPILFLWGLQKYEYEKDGIVINVSICEKSSTYAGDNYPFIYISVVYSGPIGFMMTAICVSNILLARTLMKRMFKCRTRGNRRNGINNKTTGSSTSPHRERQKDSSLSSFTAVTEHCATESTKLGNGVIQTSSSSSTMTESMTSEEQICHSHNYSDDSVEKRKDPVKISEQPPVLGNNADTVRSTNWGKTMSPYKKPGSINMRRKTLIMLTLTSVYIVTMTTYICLVSMVAKKDGILRRLSDSDKVVFFFFLRLYFVNTCINPILYGIMDPRFKRGLKQLLCRKGFSLV